MLEKLRREKKDTGVRTRVDRGEVRADIVPILRKTAFLRHLYIKTIVLPRQARDKHRENSKKDAVFRTSASAVMLPGQTTFTSSSSSTSKQDMQFGPIKLKSKQRVPPFQVFPMLVPSPSWLIKMVVYASNDSERALSYRCQTPRRRTRTAHRVAPLPLSSPDRRSSERETRCHTGP
jgi:hypothetical protein